MQGDGAIDYVAALTTQALCSYGSLFIGERDSRVRRLVRVRSRVRVLGRNSSDEQHQGKDYPGESLHFLFSSVVSV